MKRRPQISHAAFSAAFPVLLYAICNLLNIDKLAKWFTHKDGLDLMGFSAYLVIGLCLFIAFFVLLAHRRTIKGFAILLVVLSGAVAYFISKYNIALDSSMVLNVVHTDSVEVGQLLSLQMVPYVLLLIVAPIGLIVSVEITFRPGVRYLVSSAKVFATAIIVALICAYFNFTAIHRAGNVSNKYIIYSLVPINVIQGGFSAASKSIRPYFASRQKGLQIRGRVTSKDDLIVVLAIGESSRRKNFSLYGYERRNTNPVLSKVDGLHLLNGVATRGTTLYALPQILERNGIKLPTIVSKLGIPTSCLVNYTMYDNCDGVGEIKVSNCRYGAKCYDEDVIPLLEESLETYTDGARFIVLHLGGGSHGPVYGDRHPPEFAKLQPTCDDADIANQCTLEQIYNSYDNTILYADHVLGEVVQRLDRSGAPYVFIYLSDHGESLMEEGRMFHGMPPGVSLPAEQAEVPLIVKSSVPISIAERAEYRQQDVFDTVVKLFSIETTMVDTSRSFIERPAAAHVAAGGADVPGTDRDSVVGVTRFLVYRWSRWMRV